MTTSPRQENLYIQRINAVIGHVRENLNDDLSLDTLARVAGFSPFHFHRIFKSITEETVNDIVMRLRLERAAALLRSTPKLSVTDAAFESGFKSISVFSRAFKKRYGLNAKQWDRQSSLKNSKNGQLLDGFPRYTLENLSGFAQHNAFEVSLRSLPAQRLAYIRVFDSYSQFSRVKEVYHRLIEWYCGRGGTLEKTTLYGMSQDDPDVTPLRLCRFDWCVTVPADWQAEADVSVRNFPACQVATIHCMGDIRQEDKAIQYLFRYWLPRSRYQPANLPGMEIYRRQPAELGWEIYDIECAIPIVAL
ncbi:MAG: AraC family transcriptional regulator [Anaerolineae bacterium]|nr:AraC family transcriptional regulator [Anaerolineae bacterium]MCI0608198.1 AraC family transcriptional regulator [Anaerolineae bacterium]